MKLRISSILHLLFVLSFTVGIGVYNNLCESCDDGISLVAHSCEADLAAVAHACCGDTPQETSHEEECPTDYQSLNFELLEFHNLNFEIPKIHFSAITFDLFKFHFALLSDATPFSQTNIFETLIKPDLFSVKSFIIYSHQLKIDALTSYC